MRPYLTIPGKLAPGDKVAVVSPSFAAPGPFPEVHELAMARLREEEGIMGGGRRPPNVVGVVTENPMQLS